MYVNMPNQSKKFTNTNRDRIPRLEIFEAKDEMAVGKEAHQSVSAPTFLKGESNFSNKKNLAFDTQQSAEAFNEKVLWDRTTIIVGSNHNDPIQPIRFGSVDAVFCQWEARVRHLFYKRNHHFLSLIEMFVDNRKPLF